MYKYPSSYDAHKIAKEFTKLACETDLITKKTTGRATASEVIQFYETIYTAFLEENN